MIINERCDRVHLINLLEEPGNCMKFDYCRFLTKLRNALQEMPFFTSNTHIKNWDIKYTNNILIVEPVALSSSLDNNGIIQNNNKKRNIKNLAKKYYQMCFNVIKLQLKVVNGIQNLLGHVHIADKDIVKTVVCLIFQKTYF